MTGFVEVPVSQVRKTTRIAVAERLVAVAADLTIPIPTIRWFKRTAHAPEYDEIRGDFALHILNVGRGGRALAGKALAIPTPMIWVRASLHWSTAVHVVAHEARHVWQQLNWHADDYGVGVESAEVDAEEYADRWLGQKVVP